MARHYILYFLSALFAFSFLWSSCDDDDDEVSVPKPRGYFRIALPERKYTNYNTDCPYTFEIPNYASVQNSAVPNAEPCWRDVVFGQFKATLYLSYKAITNDTILRELITDSWLLTEKHRQVAQGRRETEIIRPNDNVYGTFIDVAGNAATGVQFYLTDSVRHFVHGSLYFYALPNKDSLKPALEFIRQDILHIAETLRWKNNSPLPKTKIVPGRQPSAAIVPDSKK